MCFDGAGGFPAVHTPVLLEECVAFLGPRRAESLMVDGTIGEGGHSEAFLRRFPNLRIIGIDADSDILNVARARLAGFGDRIEFYHGWSHDFFGEYDRRRFASAHPGGVKNPDTILLDLGVSLFHYEKAGRGFSFQKDEALDMRIDRSRGKTAAELVASLQEKELADILYFNAGERYSRRIAAAITSTRRKAAIESSCTLESVVCGAVPVSYRAGRGIHPATKTFAALRIAVNGELERLPSLLEAAFVALAPMGRLGVITFHSAEDRIVKTVFRAKSGAGEGRLVTKKPLPATDEEILRNPPSRTAKLRVMERTE